MFIHNNRGYVLVTTMIALAVVALLGTATLNWASTSLRLARKGVESEQALYLANAGVEDALAQFMNGQNPTAIAPHTLTVTAGLQGSYRVSLTTQPDQTVSIVSTGTVGKSTRVVTAVLQPGSGGSGGSGGNGGGTGPEAPPPGVPAQVFQQAVWSNGALTFDNNAVICGDLYVVGSVSLGNNTRVAGSPGAGCSSVTGTGMIVATGLISIGNNSVIDGGWCDAINWGAGHPCATAPSAAPLPAPDFGALNGMATVHLNGSQTLADTQSYSNAVVYINGDLTVDQKGAAITGTVTFAVTGSVTILGDVTCAGTCSVAVIAAGSIQADHNDTIWATLLAGGALSLGNQVTVHGNIQAATMSTGNGPVFYPLPVSSGGGTPAGGPSLKGWNS